MMKEIQLFEVKASNSVPGLYSPFPTPMRSDLPSHWPFVTPGRYEKAIGSVSALDPCGVSAVAHEGCQETNRDYNDYADHHYPHDVTPSRASPTEAIPIGAEAADQTVAPAEGYVKCGNRYVSCGAPSKSSSSCRSAPAWSV